MMYVRYIRSGNCRGLWGLYRTKKSRKPIMISACLDRVVDRAVGAKNPNGSIYRMLDGQYIDLSKIASISERYMDNCYPGSVEPVYTSYFFVHIQLMDRPLRIDTHQDADYTIDNDSAILFTYSSWDDTVNKYGDVGDLLYRNLLKAWMEYKS